VLQVTDQSRLTCFIAAKACDHKALGKEAPAARGSWGLPS
jgi:hypothetical protein